MPSPRENPKLWQRLIWGPATLPPESIPGHCTISDLKQKIKKSTPKTSGNKGNVLTTLGLENVEGKAEIHILNGSALDGSSYYDLLMAEWTKVYPPKAPAQCSHGAFGVVGMTDGQITSFDGLKWDGGRGVLTFSFEGWTAPKVITGGGCGCTPSPEDAAQLAKLKAYANKLAADIANNPGSPFALAQQVEGDAIKAEIQKIQGKGCSCAKTPDKADPGKQWMSKYGYYNTANDWKQGNVDPTGAPTKGDGIPLGEIQPPEVPAP